MKRNVTKTKGRLCPDASRLVYYLFLLLFSFFFLHAQSQSPTAPALGFNVFLQKGATLTNNETEGPVALGGDLTLSQNSYQVSTNYTGTFKVNNVPVTLVVGGKVNYNGGNGLSVNQNGYIKIGTAGTSKVWYKDPNNAYSPIRITPGSDYNSSPKINLQANSQQLGVNESTNPVFQSNVIDFDAAFAKLKASSASISACADNASLTDPNGNNIAHTNLPNQVKINLHVGINTLNLTGRDMNTMQVFTYNNAPDANHILVINVNAPGTFNWNVYNSAGIGFQNCAYVLYNFYNTTILNFQSGAAVEGTVFAPYADIVKTGNQSNIEGQVIGQSYVQNGGENHYALFAPTVIGCSVVCNLSLNGTKTDISCNSAANGAIDITASGNSGLVSYTWNDGFTTKDRAGLKPGNYSVLATDAAGCKASSPIYTISEPGAIAVTSNIINTTTVGGNSGSINITVSGGTSPYSYKWKDGITTEDRTGLKAGTYSATVTDKNGCSCQKTFTISEPVCILSLSGTKTDITCNGSSNGVIDITTSGNNGTVIYQWNDCTIATEDRTELAPGSYSVIATDAVGCKDTSEVYTINQPNAIAISGTTINTIASGKNGSIDVSVSGGTAPYTYQWSDCTVTTEDRTGLVVGNYTVTVTDKNGCSCKKTFAISEIACNLSVSAATTNITCNGSANGSINITATGNNGNTSYLWNDGAVTEDRTGLQPGSYCEQVTDSAGCKITTPMYVISQPAAIAITGTVVNVSTVGGKSGSINITISGGTSPYSYKWNDGVTTEDRKGLKAGNYTVTVTDKNGCSCSKTFTVSDPVCNIKLTGTIKSVCCYGGNDGSIDLTVSGNVGKVSYAWKDGPATEDRTNLVAGTYSVKATDSIGCTASCSNMVVKQSQPLQVSATVTGQSSTQVCNGTAKLSATGGTAPYTFTWSDGYTGASRTGLCMGAYQVTVKDKMGCTSTYTVKISCPGDAAKTGITAITSSATAINADVSLSPNPTTGLIRISINAEKPGKATVAVYDFSGKSLIQKQMILATGANQQQVDLSPLAKGLYEVQVATEAGSKIFKVILN